MQNSHKTSNFLKEKRERTFKTFSSKNENIFQIKRSSRNPSENPPKNPLKNPPFGSQKKVFIEKNHKEINLSLSKNHIKN